MPSEDKLNIRYLATRGKRVGGQIPIAALGPAFDRSRHQVYRDLLDRALADPSTRSVALTGAYGSGKSSVLDDLPVWSLNRAFPWVRRNPIVRLTLSTLDPALAPVVSGVSAAEHQPFNRIQKELVKQLLYQRKATATPNSRFPRATRPSRGRAVLAGMAGALLVLVAWVATALGQWQGGLEAGLKALEWSPGSFWAFSAGSVGLLVGTIAYFTAGRYVLGGEIKTGALSLSLSPSSVSYFDQYLDEIMYFFQVSGAGVVLIEDVDRFEDALVFDTLRALNVLVNSSRQVGRRVVFVYAIRDSVLGGVGTRKATGEPPRENPLSERAKTDPAKDLERSNRAKYFDLIIPIVPFVTTGNARDLLMQVMAPHVLDGQDVQVGISPSLIRLAARHIADMRTMLTVRNEFEVHFNRLMGSDVTPMPEISHDIVFALVLVRATSPDQYEQIRLATSGFDELTKRWRNLVEENLSERSVKLVDLEQKAAGSRGQELRASRAGELLEQHREDLFDLAPGVTATRLRFEAPLTEEDLGDLAGWRQIAAGEHQQVRLWYPRSGNSSSEISTTKGVPPNSLSRILGISLDVDSWAEAEELELGAQIDGLKQEIEHLRFHTWRDLYRRTDVMVKSVGSETTSEGEAVEMLTFADLLHNYVPSELSRELIAEGFLPRHYARYASMFYGVTLNLAALDYIARSIETGVPDIEANLDDVAVQQILEEQGASKDGADLFDDRSVYNLDIVSYLLEHRASAAATVARRLGERWEGAERDFVDRFFKRRDRSSQLAALMAPHWKSGLRYLVDDAVVTESRRLELIDAYIGHLDDSTSVEVDQDTARYLTDNYVNLTSVTSPRTESDAVAVSSLFAAAGALIEELSELNATALSAATMARIYPLTAMNLAALGGLEKVALDTVLESDKGGPLRDHFLAGLGEYLSALKELDPAASPVAAQGGLATVLQAVVEVLARKGTLRMDGVETSNPLIERLVEMTAKTIQVDRLGEVDPSCWVALARHRRFPLTFENVWSYYQHLELDEELCDALREGRAIRITENDAADQREVLARSILESDQWIPDPTVRAELASSLLPDGVPIHLVGAEYVDVVAPLLVLKAIPDDESIFIAPLLDSWEAYESVLATSETFATSVPPSIVPPRLLAPLLASQVIRKPVIASTISGLPSFLPGATAADATRVANALQLHDHAIGITEVSLLQSLGADSGALLGLAVRRSTLLSKAELRALIRPLGGDWTRLADGGSGKVHFAVTDTHHALLDKLEGVTHTGASVRETNLHGESLEAYLCTPRVP